MTQLFVADCPICQQRRDSGQLIMIIDYFREQQVAYDVNRALQLVQVRPRTAEVVDPELHRFLVEVSHADDYHVSHVDTSTPCIMGVTTNYKGESEPIFLDGNHRCKRLWREGKPLLAYELTKAETEGLVVMTTPLDLMSLLLTYTMPEIERIYDMVNEARRIKSEYADAR